MVTAKKVILTDSESKTLAYLSKVQEGGQQYVMPAIIGLEMHLSQKEAELALEKLSDQGLIEKHTKGPAYRISVEGEMLAREEKYAEIKEKIILL